MEKNKRVDIKLGYLCNNNCIFCANSDERFFEEKGTEEVKRDLTAARDQNVSSIYFNGGEPTIRKDFFEIVSYAKELGFDKISIFSNGRMFSYKSFLKKAMEAGLNGWVHISLHGYDKILGDYLSRTPGSFEQTVRGIENISKSGLELGIDVVISKLNYKYLEKIISLTEAYNIKSYHFIFIKPCGDTLKNKKELIPKVSDVITYLQDSIRLIESKSKRIKITIENFQPCVIRGYEKYIVGLRNDSWYTFQPGKKEERTFDIIGGAYTKTERCDKCAYFNRCDGILKEYIKTYGDEEFIPIIKR